VTLGVENLTSGFENLTFGRSGMRTQHVNVSDAEAAGSINDDWVSLSKLLRQLALCINIHVGRG